jgi:hypothetical protein
MRNPANGTSQRLLTLLDLAKATLAGASLGADLDDSTFDRYGPAVAADLNQSVAADLITQEPSVAADGPI